MKPILFPDYENSILNVSNSILKYYGCPVLHPSLKIVDDRLNRKFRNVILVLVDALGDSILEKHPEEGSALRRDQETTITSVFPPTTVAATTSVLTGLPPITTGWLGWMQYILEEDKNVVFYTNKDYYNDSTEFSYQVADKYVPIKQIYEIIEEHNSDVSTKEIFPAFREPEHDSFLKEMQAVVNTCIEPGKHFIYAYWDKLDYIMHEFGPDAQETKDVLELIDNGYVFLKENLPKDSIVFVIADHSQVSVSPIKIREYKDLWDTFAKSPSIESRATAFFIKPDRKTEFESLFREYFRDKYVLYKTEDILKLNLFGFGNKHPKTDEFLGDYMGIAIDNYYFKLNEDPFTMKGQHAGLLAEETIVPLIIFEKK